MADMFCSFLDFRSPSPNYYKLHLLLPSKNFSTSIAHSFSSSISKINRKPLLCKPASPAIDVISTHEHSDGSLVFRFGDPSEVVENVELDKLVTVDEEIEREDIVESSAVKDLDTDHENEVMVNEAEKEVNCSGLTELPDEFAHVELEKPVTVDEDTESEGIGEYNVVKVLDNDRESEIMFKEAEREVNSSGWNEVPDEFDPVTVVGRGDESSDSEDELPVPISSVSMEVSSSPEPDIQNIENDQEVLNEDHEYLSLENVSVAHEISEIENTIVTEGFSENKIGNATTLQPVPFEPENNISQSNSGTVVTIDDSVVSEDQNVDAELHNETIDVSSSFSEEVQISTDVSVDSVEAESQNEISKDGIEIDSSELLSNSSNLQIDVSLSEEAECETSQVSVQTVVMGNEGKSDANGIVAKTPQLEADITEIEARTSETGIRIQNVIVKDGSESDELKAESQNEISEDGRETDSSELLSNSPNSQVDIRFSEVAECETSQVPLQSVVTGNGSEIDANDIVADSPQLEAAINLSTKTEAHTSETGVGIANEIGKDESESGMMQFTSVIPQLEDESKLDEEMGDGIVEESKEDEVIDSDGSENDMIQLTPVSPQAEVQSIIHEETDSDLLEELQDDDRVESPSMLEAESKIDEEIGNGSVEESKEDEVTGNDGRENDMIKLTLVPPQANVQSVLYEETDSDYLEELRDDDRVESSSMMKDAPQDLVLETERIKEDDNVQISRLPEASVNEVTEPESTESAANSEQVMTDFVLSSGAALLPHPSKVLTGGEDAYFVNGQTWLGVADGILQWSLDGTNPGVYAQNLIRNCEKLASDRNGNSISYPLDLLNSSVAETRSSGCSTVLLAKFDGQVLHVANVGDSGFVILRHGTIYKKSRPMLHAFHFPLQIERDNDPCPLAELYQVDLEEDDVIVIATDGLFDNLYDQEISSIVFKSLAADLKLEEIAELLATKAQEVGRSTSSRSPIADSAQAAGYVGYTGGKLDDVTVIVSVVQRQSSSVTL